MTRSIILSDIAEFIIDCEHKTAPLVEHGIPSVRTTDLKNGRIILESCNRVSEETYIEWTTRLEPQPSDLLLSREAPVGEVGIVPPNTKLCLGQRTVLIRLKQDQIDPRFLLYLFLTDEMRHELISKSEGSVVPHLNMADIRSLPLQDLPSLPSQHAIARILSSLDDKIELNRQMNETLEAMARAIFQSWFVDFDPVRAKVEGRQPAGMDAATAALFPSGFDEVDGREVPKGWGVKPLDQTATFLNGLALQNYPPDGEDFLPVIKIAQLHKGDTEGSDRASVNIPSEYIVDDGDILFSWSGSLEVVIWCGGKGALNQHLFKVTSDKYPKWFSYLWVLHHLPDFQMIAEGKATTMGHIQRHHLSEAFVLIPSDKEIQAMNRILEPLINKIIANNMQSRTLTQIRDALLPKLMSGEISIGNDLMPKVM